MADDSIKVGDMVQLKAGGPKMTVTADTLATYSPGRHLECVWHVNGTEKRSVYPEVALVKAAP